MINQPANYLDLLQLKFALFKSKPEEERVQLLGVEAARVITDGKGTIETLFMPLALLYQQMASRGQITAMRDLGRDKLLMWWTLACQAEMDAPKYKKIWRLQALYMYSLIIEMNV